MSFKLKTREALKETSMISQNAPLSLRIQFDWLIFRWRRTRLSVYRNKLCPREKLKSRKPRAAMCFWNLLPFFNLFLSQATFLLFHSQYETFIITLPLDVTSHLTLVTRVVANLSMKLWLRCKFSRWPQEFHLSLKKFHNSKFDFFKNSFLSLANSPNFLFFRSSVRRRRQWRRFRFHSLHSLLSQWLYIRNYLCRHRRCATDKIIKCICL